MTIASRNQSSHYQEAKSNLQSLVKQTYQVGLGFAVMLLVTAGRPSAFGLSVTVGLGIAFVAWSEVRRLDSDNFSINEETQRENTKTYDDPVFQNPLYSQEMTSGKENSLNEDLNERLLDSLVLDEKSLSFLVMIREKENSLNKLNKDLNEELLASLIYEELLDSLLQKIQISKKVIEQIEFSKKNKTYKS